MILKKIFAGFFKAKCYTLQQTRSNSIKSNRAVPVLFGAMKHSVTIKGNITSPIDEQWYADKAYNMQTSKHTLFISDLHLQEASPKIADIFFRFLKNDALKADALYILGDFFDVWIGDDDITDFHQRLIQALKTATDAGLPIYFMRGNRDFLMGQDFMRMSGMTLLPDPTVIHIYGQPVLLMHGDSLCTLDKAHQRFRSITQNALFQRVVYWLPLSRRRKIAAYLRERSKLHQHNLANDILDVTQEAVDKAMKEANVTTLIHGHTHRPDMHVFDHHQRIVLSDWHQRGHALQYFADHRCEFIWL